MPLHPPLNRRIPIHRPIKPQQIFSHPLPATANCYPTRWKYPVLAILEPNPCPPHPSN
jgi:hypothetical protein